MTPSKKALILLSAIFIVISGIFIINYNLNSYSSSDPAASTVYIENGVSGVVTITDPFLNRTSELKIDYYPISTGSGVIITGDGYIITAFHVIGDPETSSKENRAKKMENGDIIDYLEKAALNQYISNANPQLDNQLINDTNNSQISNVANTELALESLKQKNLISTKSFKQVIKVRLPSSTGNINSIYSYDAQVIDFGDQEKNEDIALLKINPLGNLPSLKIASKRPLVGDNIRIYGYPGNKGIQYQTESSLTPSSSSGLLTSTRPNYIGTVYYQTSAPTAKGYSGGPVVNNQNKVVGIIIYGIERHSYLGEEFKSESSLFISSKHLINICRKNNVNYFN